MPLDMCVCLPFALQDFLPEIYDMYNPGAKAASEAYTKASGKSQTCSLETTAM